MEIKILEYKLDDITYANIEIVAERYISGMDICKNGIIVAHWDIDMKNKIIPMDTEYSYRKDNTRMYKQIILTGIVENGHEIIKIYNNDINDYKDHIIPSEEVKIYMKGSKHTTHIPKNDSHVEYPTSDILICMDLEPIIYFKMCKVLTSLAYYGYTNYWVRNIIGYKFRK